MLGVLLIVKGVGDLVIERRLAQTSKRPTLEHASLSTAPPRSIVATPRLRLRL